MTVTDVIAGTQIAKAVNSWNIYITENEQKIFKVVSTSSMNELTVTNVSRPDYIVAMDELQASNLALHRPLLCLQQSHSPLPVQKNISSHRPGGQRHQQPPAAFLTFNINREATVYVAIDKRITKPPTWLSSWSVLADPLLVTDTGETNRRIYSKKFPRWPGNPWAQSRSFNPQKLQHVYRRDCSGSHGNGKLEPLLADQNSKRALPYLHGTRVRTQSPFNFNISYRAFCFKC